ncbi:putative ATP-dependent RNA helicase ste13 [Diplonema papillatum]|nr:putative ATP-dependent RNA helicase ste13 [Diplonema papillatum]
MTECSAFNGVAQAKPCDAALKAANPLLPKNDELYVITEEMEGAKHWQLSINDAVKSRKSPVHQAASDSEQLDQAKRLEKEARFLAHGCEGRSGEWKAMSRHRTSDVITEETKGTEFRQLSVSDAVKKGLEDSGYTNPTPIQLKAIPIGLLGVDLIVQGKAGTGKTLIFATLTLESVDTTSALPQSITISATREIALQIASVIKSVGRHVPNLSVQTFIGGTATSDDKIALKACQVVVGSAGRIKDLACDRHWLHTEKVTLFNLDEVDALLANGDSLAFINTIYRALPERKQVCTYSATYTPALREIIAGYMRTPRMISVADPKVSLRGVKEYFVLVSDKKGAAAEQPAGDGEGGDDEAPLAQTRQEAEKKKAELYRVVENVPFTQLIAFCNDFAYAQELSRGLCQRGILADCISSRLEQSERTAVIKKFTDFSVRVLISSDLTSRGIDMAKVNLIVCLDVPRCGETYMHRVGRTGRYGSLGLAINLLTRSELGKLRVFRRELRADNQLEELPQDLSALGTDYMEGVVTNDVDKAAFEQHEASRKEGKAVAAPRTTGRKRPTHRKRKRNDKGSDGGDSDEEAAEQDEEESRGADAFPQAAGSSIVDTPRGAPAYPPFYPAPPHQAFFQTPGTNTMQPPAQPLPYFNAPASLLAAPSSANDANAWVHATHQRMCDHYDRYYRSYYATAADCLMRTFAQDAVPISIPPPPPFS